MIDKDPKVLNFNNIVYRAGFFKYIKNDGYKKFINNRSRFSQKKTKNILMDIKTNILRHSQHIDEGSFEKVLDRSRKNVPLPENTTKH